MKSSMSNISCPAARRRPSRIKALMVQVLGGQTPKLEGAIKFG